MQITNSQKFGGRFSDSVNFLAGLQIGRSLCALLRGPTPMASDEDNNNAGSVDPNFDPDDEETFGLVI